MTIINSMATENIAVYPKSPVGIFNLPCGYIDENKNVITEIKVREMTGEEEDLLLSRHASGATKINGLLANCLERIGNITKREKIVEIVKELTIGDRAFLLFCIRRVTFSDIYSIQEKCPNPDCNLLCNFDINLSTLAVKPMENPLDRVFEGQLKDGTKFKYQIPTGIKETKAAEESTTVNGDMTAFLFMRLHSINGLPISWRDLKKMSVLKRNELREFIIENREKTDSHGIDTMQEYACPSCENEWKKELNTDFSFFFPFLVSKG